MKRRSFLQFTLALIGSQFLPKLPNKINSSEVYPFPIQNHSGELDIYDGKNLVKWKTGNGIWTAPKYTNRVSVSCRSAETGYTSYFLVDLIPEANYSIDNSHLLKAILNSQNNGSHPLLPSSSLW